MPKTALEHLDSMLEGNSRFAQATATIERAQLALRQEPYAVIVGCADSRVPVETIFDRGPGEIFVVRVAGNIVRADALASVEYAVEVLRTPLVLVLGHSGCGAVTAAIDRVRSGASFPGAIDDLVDAIVPAARSARRDEHEAWLAAAIDENARANAHALTARSPILAKAVADRRIAVRAAVYDIGSGQVRLLA